MGGRRLLVALAGFLLVAELGGCVTVGGNFPVEQVPNIRIGTDRQVDIERMFGPPWRTGMEDGQKTWTYGDYKWTLVGQTRTRDLVVRFDRNGVVTSYSFSSDQPEDSHIEARPDVEF
jgi:hypothetical protein